VNAADLLRLKQEIVERHGPWTSHNIHLGEGVYTVGPPVPGDDETRFRRVVQVCADIVRRPFEELRIADLGALEGGLAVEFASRGARVVAIEGREASIAKARFARDMLGLDALELVQDDVRNFNERRFGHFDVVIAAGIIYHLDFPEVLDFLSKLQAACKGIAIVDTEIAPEGHARNFECAGITYRGVRFEEATGAELDRDVLWSSIGNKRSFEPTRASLLNALLDSGFTSVLECHVPPVRDNRARRATMVAINGSSQDHPARSALNGAPLGRVPAFDLTLQRSSLLRRALRNVPARVRREVRRVLPRHGAR
jgi:hypothetical protein